MYYWILAAVVYIVGGTYTYKKERWEYKQEMIHYQGTRPDTLQFVKQKYKHKPIIYVTDTTEQGDVFRTGEIK